MQVVPHEVLQVGNSLRTLDLTNNKIGNQNFQVVISIQRKKLVGSYMHIYLSLHSVSLLATIGPFIFLHLFFYQFVDTIYPKPVLGKITLASYLG